MRLRKTKRKTSHAKPIKFATAEGDKGRFLDITLDYLTTPHLLLVETGLIGTGE